MESIKSIYRIGHGPSSSHTMAPARASKIFKEKYPATSYQVILYGSLALTGKGHLTDQVIKEELGHDTDIIFDADTSFSYHPNAMKFLAYHDNTLIGEWLVFSIGGGAIRSLGEDRCNPATIYEEKNMKEVLKYCSTNHLTILEYIDSHEDLNSYLEDVWQVMQEAIADGIKHRENLPGPLNVARRAHSFYKKYLESSNPTLFVHTMALAVAEENASGAIVATAPTCGSCGILPATLSYAKKYLGKSDLELINALKIAGLIGLIVKNNASISGAEVGCQGEVGVASSMASGALTYLLGGTNEQIEYAAEIGLEHHLGLTCDPVNGQVQIPCIERNAMSAAAVVDIAQYAMATNGKHYISFDHVVKTMMETGLDLSKKYKETSIGGLAKK